MGTQALKAAKLDKEQRQKQAINNVVKLFGLQTKNVMFFPLFYFLSTKLCLNDMLDVTFINFTSGIPDV